MSVYVAGPYTRGDVAVNVAGAIDAADALLEAGHCPYVPHLSHFWHFRCPHEYVTWIDLDLAWLSRCDCLLRLPGESKGAGAEVKAALQQRKPVFFSMASLLYFWTCDQKGNGPDAQGS